MESLYLLIPLSVLLILGIAALIVWAVLNGQFENLDAEGRRIVDRPPLNAKLARAAAPTPKED
jgi:cbb3-type cytochrome oxidase maturation protein